MGWNTWELPEDPAEEEEAGSEAEPEVGEKFYEKKAVQIAIAATLSFTTIAIMLILF